MHVVIVCDAESAVVFRYDTHECSQDQLTSMTMPRRRGGIQADYSAMATELARWMRYANDDIAADDIIVLATTRSYSDARVKAIVDELERSKIDVVQRCTVAVGGQAGFNETLSNHLPSHHHAVSAPSISDDDDAPPPPKQNIPPPRTPTMLGTASNAFTSLLARAR